MQVESTHQVRLLLEARSDQLAVELHKDGPQEWLEDVRGSARDETKDEFVLEQRHQGALGVMRVCQRKVVLQSDC